MEQEELQYEEVVEAGEGGEESFVGAAEDDHHLNDTDQSIETELEAIKGEVWRSLHITCLIIVNG